MIRRKKQDTINDQKAKARDNIVIRRKKLETISDQERSSHSP